VRATLPVAEALTVSYALTNGVQQTEDVNAFQSHLVTAVVSPRRGLTWTVNVYTGQEEPADAEGVAPDGRFTVIDSYVNWAATSQFSLALDVNRTRNEVWRADDGLTLLGLGAYARYQMTGADALAIRYERLDDEGLFAPFDQALQETTLTYERTVTAGFLVRGEYRRDWSSRAFFTSATPGRPSRGQHTATAGLVWWFGNKSGTW